MFQRTIVKLYKKPDCYCCDFLPYVEIANTPEQIKEQIAIHNGIEDKNHDFFVMFHNCDYEDVEQELQPVYLKKVYNTNIECDGHEKAKYCLYLVEMTEEMNRLEMSGCSCFDIVL
jgi:hypothetical protein